MTNERFEELLKELDGNSVKTLAEKNARYSADSGDALHNFKEGAEIFGDTPAQTCWGYVTKHLTALRDKVKKNDFSDREDFLEKCQDTINYIRFLWCIGNEEIERKSEEKYEFKYNDGYVIVFRKHDDSAVTHIGKGYIIREDDYEFTIVYNECNRVLHEFDCITFPKRSFYYRIIQN